MDVSRETSERLDAFEALVLHWGSTINLVAKSTLASVKDRHIADSLPLYDLAGEGQHWVDLGSGGGFPGLVMAILAKEHHPSRHFTLVDADQRKGVFLREVVRALDLNARILTQRIDEVPPLDADILSARALAPLDVLLGFSSRHRKESGISLFPKGATYQDEIAVARNTWHFDPVIHRSATDSAAVILEVRSASHA